MQLSKDINKTLTDKCCYFDYTGAKFYLKNPTLCAVILY